MGPATLRTASDFERVFAEKRRFFKDGLGFYFRMHWNGQFRFGMVTPKRFGKAVERNKFRRRIRELMRRSECLPPGIELVISVYKPLREIGFEIIKRTLKWALEKLGRFEKSAGEKAFASV